MDFAKTFDVIDHDLLVWIVSGDTYFTCVISYRYIRETVHVFASTSDVRALKYGVPQGSVLGPLLFSIYINDLPLFIKACCEHFADDTTIHRKLSESLQESVNSLLELAEFNHMSLRPNKTNLCL